MPPLSTMIKAGGRMIAFSIHLSLLLLHFGDAKPNAASYNGYTVRDRSSVKGGSRVSSASFAARRKIQEMYYTAEKSEKCKSGKGKTCAPSSSPSAAPSVSMEPSAAPTVSQQPSSGTVQTAACE
jgi:hypothetical protein